MMDLPFFVVPFCGSFTVFFSLHFMHRRGDGALLHGVWGYNPEGFEFEGRTYPCLFQLYGDKECRLYMDISEDRQKLRFIREDNHAEASWLSYG